MPEMRLSQLDYLQCLQSSYYKKKKKKEKKRRFKKYLSKWIRKSSLSEWYAL